MSAGTQVKLSSRKTAEPAVRPPCQIDARAIISEKAQLTGAHKITIGANTVIHPYAKLDSSNCSIIIGENCIIFERATIGLLEPNDLEKKVVAVGSNICINSRAVVQSHAIGDGSVVEVGGTLGPGSTVGEVENPYPHSSRLLTRQFCKIKPAETLEAGHHLPSFTVLFGKGQYRIDTALQDMPEKREAHLKEQSMQIDLLRQLIPSNIAKWAM